MANGNQEFFAGIPWTLNSSRRHRSYQSIVDKVSNKAKRKLAKCDQMFFFKEAIGRSRGTFTLIDFSLIEAVKELLGAKINEFDRVGPVEKGVGDPFANYYAGDLFDEVCAALDMLNIDGGENIDTACQEFFNVLIAFRMTRTGNIRMRQLIDQNDGWFSFDRPVNIKLFKFGVAIDSLYTRQNVKAFK